MTARVAAVDWSGARDGGAVGIWTGEARDGHLSALTAGRDRRATVDHLIALAESEPELVAGLDFCFSMPGWFLDSVGATGAPELWEVVARDGERWLAERASPFWGHAGSRRPSGVELLRDAERELAEAGHRPKSVFQLTGSGQVGPGSIRGMPLLRDLRAAGFAVWPFDPVAPGRPVAVEIYPRLLTGPVVKRDPAARRKALTPVTKRMGADARSAAESSEDAFDAALAALAMDARHDELRALGDPGSAAAREGWIWRPGGEDP